MTNVNARQARLQVVTSGTFSRGTLTEMRLDLSAIDDKRLSFMLGYWERLTKEAPRSGILSGSAHSPRSAAASRASGPRSAGHYADAYRTGHHSGGHPSPSHIVLRHQTGHLAPSRRAIDPIKIPRHILPHLFLADVRNEVPRYLFRLAGTALEDRFGFCRGASLDMLHLGSESADVRGQYDAVVEEGEPVYCVHDFEDSRGRAWRYRRLLMPLSTDRLAVDGLFGAVVFSPMTL